MFNAGKRTDPNQILMAIQIGLSVLSWWWTNDHINAAIDTLAEWLSIDIQLTQIDWSGPSTTSWRPFEANEISFQRQMEFEWAEVRNYLRKKRNHGLWFWQTVSTVEKEATEKKVLSLLILIDLCVWGIPPPPPPFLFLLLLFFLLLFLLLFFLLFFLLFLLLPPPQSCLSLISVLLLLNVSMFGKRRRRDRTISCQSATDAPEFQPRIAEESLENLYALLEESQVLTIAINHAVSDP